ncbi:rCG41277 [Rattus norvegicus]|uniref:RCG41277 n=1 Tax=Rattus norvegicus TaxID=10116 RepID=A6KNF5_RAT|nr:rCG41277 [Rattus norvegicus]
MASRGLLWGCPASETREHRWPWPLEVR